MLVFDLNLSGVGVHGIFHIIAIFNSENVHIANIRVEDVGLISLLRSLARSLNRLFGRSVTPSIHVKHFGYPLTSAVHNAWHLFLEAAVITISLIESNRCSKDQDRGLKSD